MSVNFLKTQILRQNRHTSSATMQYAQHCPSTETVRVGFEFKEFPGLVRSCTLSWNCEQECLLWQLAFFSHLNMCPVGTGLETTQISSNQLLVPRVGFGIVIRRSVLSLVTSAYISQCSLGVPLFLASWNCWNEKALFKVWLLHPA